VHLNKHLFELKNIMAAAKSFQTGDFTRPASPQIMTGTRIHGDHDESPPKSNRFMGLSSNKQRFSPCYQYHRG
jgi:hypothetical protein